MNLNPRIFLKWLVDRGIEKYAVGLCRYQFGIYICNERDELFPFLPYHLMGVGAIWKQKHHIHFIYNLILIVGIFDLMISHCTRAYWAGQLIRRNRTIKMQIWCFEGWLSRPFGMIKQAVQNDWTGWNVMHSAENIS